MPRCVAPRMAVYVLLSLLSTVGTVLYAWQTRVQFYPTVIFLVTSKASVLVLCNLFLCMTILLGKVIKTVFLGTLRDREVEVLWENSRFTITNTCLLTFVEACHLTERFSFRIQCVDRRNTGACSSFRCGIDLGKIGFTGRQTLHVA